MKLTDSDVPRLLAEKFGTPERYLAFLDRQDAEDSLYEFIKMMWHIVEPARPFVDGWHIEAICEHLEAVSDGEIKRLLINVPPGCLKSIAVDVMFPAWEWGPRRKPSMRYLCASYSQELTVRDNDRFRGVVTSERYQSNWGDAFSITSLAKIKVANDKTGFKYATSVGGVGTGERGDRIICDDPNNVKEVESDTVRYSTNHWFREVLPNRLISLKDSAIIVIQQRTHAEDVSGVILTNELGYEHLMIPMEYDAQRRCKTSIGWEDPRTRDGEYMCPALFDREGYERTKREMTPYAVAGQYQQAPSPRGGNIIMRDWWQVYDPPETKSGKMSFPPMEFILASLDTAYTEKQENDYSALTVWGVWRDDNNLPKIMLMDAWKKRLSLHGAPPLPGVPKGQEKEMWGLVEWVAHSCQRWKVDTLLIEDKAAGHSVAQEIRRLYLDNDWGTRLVTPKGDKVARLHSVAHLWSEGVVYAPERQYAEMVINEMCSFPRSAHDDLTDSASQALRWMRDSGIALRRDEGARDYARRNAIPQRHEPLYDA